MAGKGYRPALFELVRKGPLKPNQKGKISTPKWFYNHQGGSSAVEPLRKEPGLPEDPREDFPVKYPQEASEYPEFEPEATPVSIFGLHIADKRLAFWAPYWAVGLFFLGLILSLLVSFWLGQNSVQVPQRVAERPTNAGLNLAEVRDGPIQQNVLDISGFPREVTETDRPQNQTVRATNGTANDRVAPQDNTAGTGRNCLILCSYSRQQELRSVQEFFSRNGVLTKLGRFDGSYILYCDAGQDSKSSPEAVRYQNQMIEMGRRYNRERPTGAASFLPSTFESAYWVLRERITKIE